MRRLLACFVSLVLIAGLLPSSALAQIAPGRTTGAGGEAIGQTAGKLLYSRPVSLVNPAPAENASAWYSVQMNMEAPDVQGRDIAVRYTGDSPSLVFIYYWDIRNDDAAQSVRSSGWEGWTSVDPYMVASADDGSGQSVAFFASKGIDEAWRSNKQVWADNHKGAGDGEAREHVAAMNNQNTKYNHMMVSVRNGTCNLVEVVALGVDEPAAPAMRAADDVRTGEQIVSDMGAGYNFGGQLECYLHSKVDGKDVVSFNPKDGGWMRSDLSAEVSWGNPYMSEEMFKAVKERGFNTVRIPVSWGQHIYPEGNPTCRPSDSEEPDPLKRYHIDKAWMQRVHQVVDFAMRNDLYVILNTHHEAWIDRYDMDTEQARAEMLEELQAVWTQIAREFEGYDQRLVFEGVNEPHATDAENDREWNKPTPEDIVTVNEINKAFVELIHSLPAHENRLCLCSTYGGHPELTHIGGYVLPDDGTGLVAVSTHPYAPSKFATDKAAARTYTGEHRATLESIMQGVRAKFTDKGIPVVFDEFGSYYCEDGQGGDGRLEWLAHYITIAKGLGIPCVAWPLESRDGVRFFERETCTWPEKSASYIDTWLDVLESDEVLWGQNASICPFEHGDADLGEQLLDGERLIQSGTSDTNAFRVAFDVSWQGHVHPLEGREVVVRFEGDVPHLSLLTSDWAGNWWGIDPSFVDAKGGLAYFSADAIRLNWTDTRDLADLGKICVRVRSYTYGEDARTDESSVIKSAALVSLGASGHEWSVREIAPTCLSAGSRELYCSRCEALWKPLPGASALGHAWSPWMRIDDDSHMRVCGHDASHVEVAAHVWGAGAHTYTCTQCLATKTEPIVGYAGESESGKAAVRTVRPRPTTLVKLTALNRGFKAKWKKQASQTSGYQLQYSLKRTFKSAKAISIANVKTVSKKVSKLKPKKRYYVRIRTFKKAGKTTHCSAWSTSKSVVTF